VSGPSPELRGAVSHICPQLLNADFMIGFGDNDRQWALLPSFVGNTDYCSLENIWVR
jgi:hypothetical protein